MSDDARYAEGNREEAVCRKCGQEVYIHYHGPRKNHTLDPRAAEVADARAVAAEQERDRIREWAFKDAPEYEKANVSQKHRIRELEAEVADLTERLRAAVRGSGKEKPSGR